MSETTQQPNSEVESHGTASVKLPRRCSVVDQNGDKIGYVRRSVYYNLQEEVQGKFFKNEGTGAVEYRQKDAVSRELAGESILNYPVLVGHVNEQDQIISIANTYIATLKYRHWLVPIIIILFSMCLLALFFAMLFVNISKDYVPKLFVVEEGGTEWTQDEPINVFKDGLYNGKVIYPGMEGKYSFRLENRNSNALCYSLSFSDVNDYEINLGYRLRRNGEYVRGSEDIYVETANLNLSDLSVEANKNDTFTLEWKWLDLDPIDTVAGMEHATYTLNISFNAYIQDRS